jgi:hypothetical protein
MRPIFTIHAGEFLVGAHLEGQKALKGLNIWVPAKDTGVDLLVTNARNTRAASFQVKFSRDFLTTHMDAPHHRSLRVCGWFSLDRSKISRSKADYWVFVLVGANGKSRDFVLIKPAQLLTRLDGAHGSRKRFHLYLWVTADGRCWNARGLRRSQQQQLAEGKFKDRHRDFTRHLNDWAMIARLAEARRTGVMGICATTNR